ncbi:hypothetical protein [Parenemella sanctibonifatiensis]|uniref:Uncharacterized protein n=1 Tax=Parenemella sanctibonifatiensis TaxID=2016505 RepID=A0A255EKQ8_9ACTN|nr:hypothetical protein [Parenemella sanctibonifatiensis]OYN92117.1 hypothetical protein CGZ91_00950 [Parenemella sanctibonifatiensis]
MTALEEDPYAIEQAPRRQPMLYPGRWPEESVLLSGQAMWPLRSYDGVALGAHDPVDWDGFRLPHLGLAMPESDKRALGLKAQSAPMLGRVLESLNVPGCNSRVPVLCVGSNAAPAQLRDKFVDNVLTRALTIPMVQAEVSDARVGFAPVIAPKGYVPTTLLPAPGESVRLYVQFLDRDQLALVDDSELGYRRVWLGREQARTVLSTGEELPGLYAYVHTAGALADHAEGDAPDWWAMQSQLDAPRSGALAAQPAVLERCAGWPDVARVLGEDLVAWQRLATDADLREQVSAALAHHAFDHAWNDPDRFPDLRSQPLVQYGELSPRVGGGVAGTDVDGGVAPVSADGTRTAYGKVLDATLDRRGESCIRLNPRQHRAVGGRDYCELQSAALRRVVGAPAPTTIAKVMIDPDQPDDEVQVDQVLRIAIGLEPGEVVRYRGVTLRRSRVADPILGTPATISARVHLSTVATAERDVVLLDPLSLEVLGVDSGDNVVIEGRADDQGEVPHLEVKAFQVPEHELDSRRHQFGGGFGARMPDAATALGHAPDLPAILVDAALRERLGLAGTQLGTVRVRPARGQQLRGELREFTLIMAVALIGVIAVVEQPLVVIVLTAAVVVGSALLVVARLRHRLGYKLTVRSRSRDTPR